MTTSPGVATLEESRSAVHSTTGAAGTLGFVILASALLVGRTLLGPTTGKGGPLQLFALAAVLGAIWLASCLIPVPHERVAMSRVTQGVVLGAGLVALGAAIAVTGPPLPLPLSPWALPLTVLAAIAEEALFRRAAYGALLGFGVPVAIIGSALAFGLLHVPLYGVAVLPVDIGAGLLLSWQRWVSGTWTVPAATHAAANVWMVFLRWR